MKKLNEPVFGPGTRQDADRAVEWLKTEYDRTESGFYCNRRLISAAVDEGNFFALKLSGEPIGFLVLGRQGIDITEVRPEFRGNGYGRLLAEHGIARCKSRGLVLLTGECSPETSVPFWQKLGFDVEPVRTAPRAMLVVKSSNKLTSDRSMKVGVSFFPASRTYDKSVDPLAVFSCQGAFDPERGAMLEERIVGSHNWASISPDCVAQLVVDGRTLFEDKLKRPEASTVGFASDPAGTYYIELIPVQALETRFATPKLI